MWLQLYSFDCYYLAVPASFVEKTALSSFDCLGTLIKNQLTGLAWWCTPVFPALRRLSKEDCEFQASLGYLRKPSQQMNKQKFQLTESIRVYFLTHSISLIQWFPILPFQLSPLQLSCSPNPALTPLN
jgi:hypothetical protein